MAEAVHVPAQSVLPGSPKAKKLCRSTFSEAELPQAKKVVCLCTQVPSVVSDSLWPCGLWPARLLCQGGGLNTGYRQEYWSILANTGRHTLLERYTSCHPSRQPLEYLVLPEPLGPKQLPHLHTWPSWGQTQVLQGRLRSKPQWTIHM